MGSAWCAARAVRRVPEVGVAPWRIVLGRGPGASPVAPPVVTPTASGDRPGVTVAPRRAASALRPRVCSRGAVLGLARFFLGLRRDPIQSKDGCTEGWSYDDAPANRTSLPD